MSKTNRVVRDEPLLGGSSTEFLRVEVFYAKGGTSYFDGGSHPRGYFLSVRPITKEVDGSTSWVMFTGVKHLLAPATRFSEKTLGLHVAGLTDDDPIVEKLKIKVLADREAEKAKNEARREAAPSPR